jgi:hypothetical protein
MFPGCWPAEAYWPDELIFVHRQFPFGALLVLHVEASAPVRMRSVPTVAKMKDNISIRDLF